MNVANFMNSFALTEKSCILKDKFGQLVIFTDLSVTKSQFKSAFAARFKGLKLLGISSMIVGGRSRRFRGKFGMRSDKKKFIITVEGGKDLDLEKL